MGHDYHSDQRHPPFRIFLASPGDVEEERKHVRSVVEQIRGEAAFRDRLSLDIIAWDQAGIEVPMIATLTPQEAIARGMPHPSACDLVIVVFWSRLGTPLPPGCVKLDGSPYLSGTEWEYHNAVTACREHGRPVVWLYRRYPAPSLPIDDPDIEEKKKQWSSLNDFFDSLKNQDSSIAGGINRYDTPDEFQKKFEHHLRDWLTKKLDTGEGKQSQVFFGPEIKKDRDVLKLLLSQNDRIRNCITQIKLLARCKRMHDSLHHIRQNGIALWRSGALGHWKSEEQIDTEAELSFVEARGNITGHLLVLNMLKNELPHDHDHILDEIQPVLNFELPERKVIKSLKKSGFEKITNRFEGIVQKAFTAANFTMTQQSGRLWEAHSKLTKGLSDARENQALSTKQDRLLNEQLELLENLIKALDQVIKCHNDWQKVHDDLYYLDTSLESEEDDFQFNLEQFLKKHSKKIDKLLKEARAEPLSISPEYLKYGDRIETWISANTDKLEKRAVTSYSSMREAFDKLFFELDNKTKDFVGQAEHQVEEYEQSLRKLEDEVIKRSSDPLGGCPRKPQLSNR